MSDTARAGRPGRLPVYYGWIIVAIAFVTTGLGVTARTAFSLMFPPIVEEFGWDRGLAAGAFSFGFLVSAAISPLVGRMMDRRGPRFVIELGVVALAAGLLAATTIQTAWQLYLYLGVLVGGGANCMTYTVQSQYLPNWFVRRRALAIGIAFSGVGVGALVLLPWLQALILDEGWRTACWALGVVVLVLLVPLNLLVVKRPEDIGLQPDGDGRADGGARRSNVVDADWVAVEWTVARAVRTARFWWIALAFFCGGFVWYAVQVHQTKYLVDVGFSPMQAAWALGLVALAGIPGQTLLGALSDRIGREPVWALTCGGFAVCYAALLGLADGPSPGLLYVMVLSQGLLGYAVTALMGPVVAEIFEGPHFGTIFGLLTVALIGGGAAGPAVAGLLYDRTGDYALAFWLCMALCAVGAFAIWRASPGLVRAVAGRASGARVVIR